MKQIKLPDNVMVPALGQGTWYMGMEAGAREAEANALRYGLDQGLTLIDTAEMYHDAELVVAEAVKGRRDDAFIVSKVLPSNASLKGTVTACERSLKRLGTECIDMYLLHWPGSYPLEDTLEAFDRLRSAGKIKRFGISNFDPADMDEVLTASHGNEIATNQVLYNLIHRGIEWDLLPKCSDLGIPVMAYSPLNQGQLFPEVLGQIGARHNVNGYQVALAWVLRRNKDGNGIIAIPKAADKSHIDRNLIAAEIELTYEELKQLDAAFPPPGGPTPLEVI